MGDISPRALILKAAGTNCDLETEFAARRVGFDTSILLVSQLLAEPDTLRDYHLFIIPGGFSYGDDLGAGKILANELRLYLREALVEFIKDGRLILGICNGFQVLAQSGLLPDPLSDDPQFRITLAPNDSGRFEARWVYLKVSSEKSDFISNEGDLVELPVAHGEGKVVASGPEVLNYLLANGQVVLKYVHPEGERTEYPWNPNGSQMDIAGICDPSGRILGLMPHPERFQEELQYPLWTRGARDKKPDGLAFFENAIKAIKRRFSLWAR